MRKGIPSLFSVWIDKPFLEVLFFLTDIAIKSAGAS